MAVAPTLVGMVALLLAGWALHWRLFSLPELGLDGALSVDLALGPLREMLDFSARDVHPPLFYALLGPWLALDGLGYVSAKFLPIAAATLALAALFALGRRLGGRACGLAAALLLLLSPAYQWLAPTVRDFGLGLLLSLLSLLLTLRLAAPPAGARRPAALCVALALCTAAALLTWYFHLFVLAAELAILWRPGAEGLPAALAGPGAGGRGPGRGGGARSAAARVRAPRRGGPLWPPSFGTSHQTMVAREPGRLQDTGPSADGGTTAATAPADLPLPAPGPQPPAPASAASLAIGALLALPWYAYVVPRLLGKLRGGTTTFGAAPAAPSPARALGGLVQALVGLPPSALALLAAAGWLLALLAGIAAVAAGRGERGRAPGRRLLLGGLLLGWLEVAAVTLRWTDVGSLARYVLAPLPFVVLLQARGLLARRMALRVVTVAGLAVLLPLQMVWYRQLATTPPIDYRHDPALASIAAHAHAGDAVVFADRAARGRYRLNGGALPAFAIHSAGQPYLADSPAQAAAVAARAMARADRLWLVENDIGGAAPPVGRQALAERAYRVWQQADGNTLLQLFLIRPALTERRLDLPLGGRIALQSADFTPTAAPGGPVAIRLIWRDERPPGASYAVFAHLDDAKGKTVAQQDGPPQLGLRPTDAWQPGQVIDDRFGFLLPADLPPGDYHLNVGLYAGPTRLALPDGANAIDLGVIQVSSR